MDKVLSFLSWLESYGDKGIYFVFLVLLACGFGFPLPEDVPLLAAGLLSGLGYVSLWFTMIICFAGVLIGDSIIFFLGSRYGDKLKKSFAFKYIFTQEREKSISEWFTKHGDKSIFFARFAPGFRVAVFFSAGSYKVPYWKFFAFDGFAALISVPVWIWLAYTLSSNLELLAEKLESFQYGLYIAIGVLLVFFLLFLFVKKKLKKRNSVS